MFDKKRLLRNLADYYSLYENGEFDSIDEAMHELTIIINQIKNGYYEVENGTKI